MKSTKSPKKPSRARQSLILLGTSLIIRLHIVSFLRTFRLGEGEVAQKPQAYLGEFVYDRNKPFAAFKFKYRSLGTHKHFPTNIRPLTMLLEALQAACIIPRSPSSESELKADELREFHGRERVCCNP